MLQNLVWSGEDITLTAIVMKFLQYYRTTTVAAAVVVPEGISVGIVISSPMPDEVELQL